jgi:hypothetical protein
MFSILLCSVKYFLCPCKISLTRKTLVLLLQKTGFPVSCGDFGEPKESTVIRALNCFSHKMEFTPKTETVVQVYPRKGEIWALYHKDKTGEVLKQARSEKDKKGKGNDNDKYQFRLVVILSNCGEGRETEILVLRKRTGYRTLWEPGYKKGSLPVEYMDRFSLTGFLPTS